MARSGPCERRRSSSRAWAVLSSAGRKTTNCCASAASSSVSRRSRSSHPDGWGEAERPAPGHHVPVQAARDIGSGGAGEFRSEPFVMAHGWPKPQVESLLVRDLVPVREERAGAGVGEDVPREVRGVGVEQPGAAHQPLVAAGAGEDVPESVGDEGDPGFEEAERLHDRRTDLAGRRARAEVGGACPAGDLREVTQMLALRRVEAERVREGTHHRHRGIAVTALLYPGQVLDADAGQRGEIRAPQTG